MIPLILLFFKIVLAILVPLLFHLNFRIILSIATKKSYWNLNRNYITCVSVWKEWTSLLCCLPIHEHDMSLYLFRFSSISLISIV